MERGKSIGCKRQDKRAQGSVGYFKSQRHVLYLLLFIRIVDLELHQFSPLFYLLLLRKGQQPRETS